MKKLRVGLVACGACATMLFSVACGSKTSEPTTSTANGQSSSAPSGKAAANAKVALVRFVDAIPGRSANLAFGDAQLFSDVAYKTVTPYKEVAGERHDFKLTTRESRNTTPVTNSEGLTNGERYTVVAGLDKNGVEKLDVINDNLSAPADGKAKIRVVNASESEVNVFAPVAENGRKDEGSADRAKHPDRVYPYANEDKWFSGVNQASSTDFKDVAPFSGNLNIADSRIDSKHRIGPAVNVPVDLRPGQLYTVIVAGGTRQYPLQGIKIDDQLNAVTTPAVR